MGIMDTRRVVASILAIFFAVLISDARTYRTGGQLRSVFSWKSLEFAYSSSEAREAAISSGDFIPGKPLPIDVDTYPGDKFGNRVFVTVPRFQLGVPVTLGYVVNDVLYDGNPVIAPFPDWDWQSSDGCGGLTSVWRIAIDRCGRMWVMDAGKIEETKVCDPQLLVFSLDTNELLTRYTIPEGQYKTDSLFVTPVVDTRGDLCEETFVYLADVTGFGIVVYDHQNSRSWRISNNLFYPYPNAGSFHIKDDDFDLMDGILGLALSPQRSTTSNEARTLYFHSLASRVESYVSTSILRNYSLFNETSSASARSFKPFPNERSSQSAAEAMDKNGVLYFGLASDLAIGCWNSRNYDFGDEFIEKLVVNPDTLQFASGMKVITPQSGRQELWVMTDSFQRVMAGNMSPNETNFRIQAGVISELVRGTKCDVASLNINSVSQSGSQSSGTFAFPE